MGKNLLFALLFCALNFFVTNIFANTAPEGDLTFPSIDTCFAPPPDSFRITGYGYGYVSLAWNPIAAGSDHLVTIYQENNSNGYDSLYSILLLNSTAYTVKNLNPEKKHVFTIRTVCGDGVASNIKSFPPLGPTGLILDLTVSGRMPSNSIKTNCTGMRCPTAPSEWIGFRISELENDEVVNSTLFEFDPIEEPSELAGVVKRVSNLGEGVVLVAANTKNEWPVGGLDKVQADLRFKAGKIIGPEELDVFGYIDISFNLAVQPITVDICDNQWLPEFRYEPLEGVVSPECQGCSPDLYFSRPLNSKGLIKVQNPSSRFLNIFFPESGFISGKRHFELLNLNGVSVHKEEIDVPEPNIVLTLKHIPFGFYVLSIEHNGEVQKTKVILTQ